MQYLNSPFVFKKNPKNNPLSYVMYSVDTIKISAIVLIQYKNDCTLILCKIMLKMKPGKQSDPWQLPLCSLVLFSVPEMLEV